MVRTRMFSATLTPFRVGSTLHGLPHLTVDGQHPFFAPVGRWFISVYVMFHPSQLVHDFVHALTLFRTQYCGAEIHFEPPPETMVESKFVGIYVAESLIET